MLQAPEAVGAKRQAVWMGLHFSGFQWGLVFFFLISFFFFGGGSWGLVFFFFPGFSWVFSRVSWGFLFFFLWVFVVF